MQITHLVYVVNPRIEQRIKACVDIIQELNNFQWRRTLAEVCKSDDGAEENSDHFVFLGRNRTLMSQIIGHRGRQN